MPDPIHQFEIKRFYNLDLFGFNADFTNSSLFMVLATAISSLFLIYAMGGRALIPSRIQSIAEIAYEFIANMLRQAAGDHAMKYFPLVFTLFIFIFTVNMLGMVPYAFTATSHIIIAAAMAIIVFLSVLVIGFAKNGFGFLKLFAPSGVPIYMMPIVVPIEIVSFLSRPISLSMRLFANMLAGHIALKVFAGFIVMLLGAGGWALLSPLPLLAAVALTALEFLVAFLQAYVFSMLTCMYLNDALHPGH